MSKQCSSGIFGKFLLVYILAHVFRMLKREQRIRLQCSDSSIEYSNPDVTGIKNEYKLTVASEESKVEADMIQPFN